MAPGSAPSSGLFYVVLAATVAGVASLMMGRKKKIEVQDVAPKPLPADFPVTPLKVLEAACRVLPHVHRTPVLTCESLDARAGRRLYFKCEVLQKTGSFKVRGATT